MTNPNLALLEEAVELLEPLLNELVFAGGCATGLLVTDPAATDIRPTRDVDAITEVTSYAQYATLSERLRELGLNEDSCESHVAPSKSLELNTSASRVAPCGQSRIIHTVRCARLGRNRPCSWPRVMPSRPHT
jgi:hypothetical protein